MEFYGISEGSTISIYDQDTDGVLGTVTVSLTDYFAQPSVEYKGDNADGLRQILEQKYLSLFQQAGQEAYFNYRRTGIPTFLVGPGTGNNNIIPKRWLYPVSEQSNNGEHYNAAVTSQFGGDGDNVNSELWINKN